MPAEEKDNFIFPEKYQKYPVPSVSKKIVFLKNVIKRPNIIVGDYTYFQDYDDGSLFENRNVLFHTDLSKDRLIIGKFCQIASKVQFIMNASLYRIDSFTSYPFELIGRHAFKDANFTLPFKGDTIVGNDVLIGYKVNIMPGVKIGNGAILGARSMITKDVPPYTIVAGNPAVEKRKRFSDEIIELLESIKWWDWPIEKILWAIPFITSGDIEKLKELKSLKELNLL